MEFSPPPRGQTRTPRRRQISIMVWLGSHDDLSLGVQIKAKEAELCISPAARFMGLFQKIRVGKRSDTGSMSEGITGANQCKEILQVFRAMQLVQHTTREEQCATLEEQKVQEEALLEDQHTTREEQKGKLVG
eukprot:2184682-Rhodomonas_salina.2